MAAPTPEQCDALIEWLLTPKDERDPRNQNLLAEKMGVKPNTLSSWKKDAEFLEKWNATYHRTVGSPETKMTIMQTLLGTATDPDDPKHVQAAKTYFEIEGSLRPPSSKNSLDITVSAKPASELSDEDLERMLASKAGDELARRRDSA